MSSLAGMSLSLDVFAVELGPLHDAIGSRDQDLLRRVSYRSAGQWTEEDDYFAEEIAAGAPTSRDATLAVINGGPFTEGYGTQYGSAFRDICGTMFADFVLGNEYFSGFRAGWLVDVGKGLEQLGITTPKLDDLVFSGMPRALPDSEGIGYGEWDNAACRAGLAQWQDSTPQQRDALHPEVLAAVENCVAWMSAAAEITDQFPDEEYGVAAFLL